MCAYQDTLEGAVVCVAAMVGALLYSAFDALVCMVVHDISSFFCDVISIALSYKTIQSVNIKIQSGYTENKKEEIYPNNWK